MSEYDRAADRAMAEMRAGIAELSSAAEDIRSSNRAQVEELRRFREQMRERDEQRAKAARRGELDADWQRVQRRIDLDQTTVAEVLQGRDDSPEAAQLRRTAAENATAIARMQEDDLDDEDETNEVFGAVRREQAELRALVQEIREISGD